jgi:protocatechuate 3,4-dioxygenase beta subunit
MRTLQNADNRPGVKSAEHIERVRAFPLKKTILLLTVLLVLLSTVLVGFVYLDQRPHDVAGAITDAETRQPIAGVLVRTGQRSASTDASGRFILNGLQKGAVLTASAPGYATKSGIALDGVLLAFSWPLSFSLQPNTLDGSVLEANGPPVVDALVKVDVQTTRSSAGGKFTLRRVPDGAMVFVTADGFSSGNAVFSDGAPVRVLLEPNTLAGTVADPANSPVGGATVSAGAKAASSDATGKYTLRGIPRGITVTVQADGYLTATYTFVETETKKVSLTPNSLTGKVTDGETGAPVVGITLQEGPRSIQVDAQGRYSLTKVTRSAIISATADGYVPIRQPVGGRAILDLALQPNQISGLVTDIKTGKPVITATVYLEGRTAKTDAQGRYTFKRVKYGATVTASADGYGPAAGTIGDSPTLDLALKPGLLSGIVKDASTGAPIAGATVAVDGAYVTTDVNGVYKLGDVPPGATVTAKYPGYRLARYTLATAGFPNIALQPFAAKGVYLPFGTVLADGGKGARALIDAMRPYGMNTIVVDVKGDIRDDVGRLIYKSASATAARIGSTRSNSTEILALLAYAKERNIYAIARVMVFKDDLIAKGAPDMAIKRRSNGAPWMDSGGSYWADPYNPAVWAYTLFIAKECAALGFDEVQFDYVRLPSDGSIGDIYYPSKAANDTRARWQVIEALMAQIPAALPNIYVSLDTFGWTAWKEGDNDLGIGQRLNEMAKYADYISPMVYPSTFEATALDYAQPAAHPYEVVYRSSVNAAKRIANLPCKIRPWIQDFDDYTFGYSYDAPQVAAQIKAAEDAKVPGWLLWNAGGVYTQGAWAR